MTFELDDSSMPIDVIPYPPAGPEEADEDVDPPVHAGCMDLALRSFTHPSRSDCWVQSRPSFILESDQGPLFCSADATCL